MVDSVADRVLVNASVVPTAVPQTSLQRVPSSTDKDVMQVLVLGVASMDHDFRFDSGLLGGGCNGGVFQATYTGPKAADLGGPFPVRPRCSALLSVPLPWPLRPVW